MTVELREPFVYPEEPKDLSPYVFSCFHFLCEEFVHHQHAIDGIEHIANESSLIQTVGRRALGTPAKSGRIRCKRRCRMDRTRPRSPIPTCARPSRSRLRRLRRTPRSGGHPRRCWVGTLRIRSSLRRGGSLRRLSGCRSSDWAALDLGAWLFRFENGCFLYYFHTLLGHILYYIILRSHYIDLNIRARVFSARQVLLYLRLLDL